MASVGARSARRKSTWHRRPPRASASPVSNQDQRALLRFGRQARGHAALTPHVNLLRQLGGFKSRVRRTVSSPRRDAPPAPACRPRPGAWPGAVAAGRPGAASSRAGRRHRALGQSPVLPVSAQFHDCLVGPSTDLRRGRAQQQHRAGLQDCQGALHETAAQTACSAGVGVRLPGGRQKTVLILKSDPSVPLRSACGRATGPPCPTKGSPALSSAAPGAFADDQQAGVVGLPDPNTDCRAPMPLQRAAVEGGGDGDQGVQCHAPRRPGRRACWAHSALSGAATTADGGLQQPPCGAGGSSTWVRSTGASSIAGVDPRIAPEGEQAFGRGDVEGGRAFMGSRQR